MNVINAEKYKDKVLGCWTGKNIGGTLGAPFEGKKEMQNVSFYTQDLRGEPEPNDDLDLQLVWLFAAEIHGVFNLNSRLLAEYWMQDITGPWGEYAVCRANIRNGLYPPLSGSCNNDKWKDSNGAWIRSEIWACLFPGEPDVAAQFAYMDACVDHCGDGIYAEMFTAALESAAFVIDDIRQLINIALNNIPKNSRIARSVNLACDLYDKKVDFADARNAIVEDNEDLGWFQAPGNIGFLILGLLYGEGDFGKSICYAVNCGDDTDCTGATAGAILGIMRGRCAIPEKWTEPIGESIKTIAIDPVNALQMPKSLAELTERVVYLTSSVQHENPKLFKIASVPTSISQEYLATLSSKEFAEEQLGNKSPYELTFDLPFGVIKINYENGPEVVPGEVKNIQLTFYSIIVTNRSINLRWLLPANWDILPSREMVINCKRYMETTVKQAVTVCPFETAYFYMPLELKLAGRNNSIILNVPLQKKGAVEHNHSLPIYDGIERLHARKDFIQNSFK